MAKEKAQSKLKREPTPSESDYSSDYSSSSDDTVEDEDGEELTPALDAAILRTLAKIRNKDGVYEGRNILAEELEAAQAGAAKRGLTGVRKALASKPFLLKDLHRENLLNDVKDDEDHDYYDEPLTNVEVERRARDDALNAFKAFADSDDEEEDLLKPRAKDEAEEAEDDEAYRAFLLEMGGGEKEVRAALGMADAPVTDYREDPESEDDAQLSEKKRAKKVEKKRKKRVQNDEDFLMDYILNRGWIDKEKKAVPTYDDIVGRRADDDEAADADQAWDALEEEDEFDERAEEFETEYNFRFEEPGASTIVTHPRNIDALARKSDDSRKEKRKAREERKKAEKEAREAEVARQQAAKKKEMEGQLAALKRELGEGVNWTAVEELLEGDFDEREWERVVGAMLNAKDAEDDDKPIWDDGLGDEYLDEENGEGDGPADAEDAQYAEEWVEPEIWNEEDDGPINMDADFIEEPKKKKSKKDKKKKALVEEDDSDLTVVQRAEKVKKAAEEMRSLDHEDEVGGLKTRFKYTRTAPQNFGLTAAEILLATDKELNELVSFKHMQPYRRGGLGMAGRGLGRRVRDLKSRLAARRWGEDPEEVEQKHQQNIQRSGPGGANATVLGPRNTEGESGEGKRPGKRLGKKERQKLAKAAEADGTAEVDDAVAPEPEPAAGAKRKREAKEVQEDADAPEGEKKKRRRKKKGGAAAE